MNLFVKLLEISDFITNFLAIHRGKIFFVSLVSKGLGKGNLYIESADEYGAYAL